MKSFDLAVALITLVLILMGIEACEQLSHTQEAVLSVIQH